MKIQRSLMLFAVVAGLAACSSGPPSPSGWQPVPGASPDTLWSTGSGATLQTYGYVRSAFSGSLQDLASQQTQLLIHGNKRAHVESDTFTPCPAQAALVTTPSAGDRTLVVGISVQNGNAVMVNYERPADMPMDSEVSQAFAKALCPGI